MAVELSSRVILRRRSVPESRWVRTVSGLVAVLLTLTAAVGMPAAHAETGVSHDTARQVPTVQFGAYVDGVQQDPSVLGEFEALVGAKTGVASSYYGFGDIFPGQQELTLSDAGRRDVLLSWDMGPTRFKQWASGRYDGYLKQIADAAAAYPYPVYVRPWPEMNGDWQSFQPTPRGVAARPRGGSYKKFIAAWRHVVSYTRRQGADNIRWVFNPTADTYKGTTPVAKIWPGSRFVDVLGLDGFNWGEDSSWGRWRSYASIFAKQYQKLTRLDAGAPVWICEFGSKEPLVDDGAPADPSRSKAAWLRDAFATTTMPRVRAMIYFQADKERDWRVNSSPAALAALRVALATD